MSDALWLLVTAGLGPLVGSFVGLLSVRLPQGRPVGVARSACAACGRRLGPAELIPVLSFVALRGRCRACRAAIPRRYPAIELGCLAIGAWAAAVHPGAPALLTALLGWGLLFIAVIDAEHLWLPDRLTLPLTGAGLAIAAAEGGEALTARAIGAGAGWLLLAGLAALYARLRGREGLGAGDARLLAASGAWVGWTGLPSVLVWASLAGLSLAAARTLTRGPPRADEPLPFGTYLALGTWLTWLYGPIGGAIGRGVG